MKRHEKKSYVITLFFTVIALSIMVIFNFFTFSNNAISNMKSIGESSLAQEKEQLSSYITKGLDVLQVTAITVEYMMQDGATDEEIKNFLLEESRRYTEDIDENYTGIYGIFKGNYIDGIGWEPDESYDPKERDWYIAAVKADGEPVIVSPYLDAQTNTIMISISKLLYDGESVISFDIGLDGIQEITENVSLNNLGYGFIIDANGLVVAHSDVGEKGANYLKDSEMAKLVEQIYADSKSTFTTKISGKKHTVFTNEIMNGWYVVMIANNSELYKDITTILIQNSIISLIIFGLVAFFCTRAFRKIERQREKLDKMNATIMETLAKTIDAKDRYTKGHSRRVAEYALEIAKRMGKTEEEQQDIYYAALLHDVGKIRIPDEIINKQSRLTDEEYSYIKLHPVAAYFILNEIGENSLIVQGAKWHHERFDGKGYPNGLSGSNIPEVARIIGVADSYDAMTSNRSYREVMSQEKVRLELEKGKNTQFDGEIADIMIEMIDEDKNYAMKESGKLNKTILVVDDEVMNIKAIQFIFKNENMYDVIGVEGGEAALQLLEREKVDLILLDIDMPEMDGFETLRRIREKSDIPVVFTTADKEMDTIQKAVSLGVDDYITKPFLPTIIKEIVHSILHFN